MNDFTLSLQITALGMGLVFGAILLLWLMMIILTALTSDKDTSTEFSSSPASRKGTMSDSAKADSTLQTDSKLQVALFAVAMAMADQETSSARPLEQPPTAIVSAWQLGMRTRQMTDKGSYRRR